MENQNNEQRSSIKLIKNTKGYQWEIKIYVRDEENARHPDNYPAVDKIALQRLEAVDKNLREKYGKD